MLFMHYIVGVNILADDQYAGYLAGIPPAARCAYGAPGWEHRAGAATEPVESIQ